MNTEHVCPSCRKPLPEGAPQGLCPECLMKAGLGSASGQPGGNPKFTPPSVAEVASLFPQLEIFELIGQGGMGAVYRARQPGLDRLVALKILPPESTAAPGFAERFAREARSLARLNHPNIVGVYDFGQAGGLHYFLMEFVDGLNLRQLAQSGRVSPREALDIVPQICDALQFAHDEGIVHRDIKPENVMVDKRGRVKITDFGLAKLLGREPENRQLTGLRDVLGTPHYMAPEQMENPNAVDHRADIYSLGVVFYELLTGELPLGKFAPPSKKVQVDVRLDEVVLHTLEREPARRYQHASQIKTDVETIAQAPRAPVPPVPPLPPARTPEEARFEDAHAQVRGPAIGLIVAAALNWVGIPLGALFGVVVASSHGAEIARSLLFLPILALLLSGVLFVAGLKMKRLQAYWLAITGSVLAILVVPGNLVGLPVGIWSLVVLTQKRVRESFGKETLLPRSAAPAGSGAWKAVAVVVVGLMLVLAIPVGAMLVSILLPALSRAKARSAAAVHTQVVAFGPEHEITLNGLETGQGAEALELDTGRVLDLPADTSRRRNAEMLKWVDEQGVDLLVERVRGRWGLFTTEANELRLTVVPEETWLNGPVSPPPATLRPVFDETLRRQGMVVQVLSSNAQPPITFSFRTAHGTDGLLQLTAFGEDPDYARLRFKFQRKPGPGTE